MNYSREERDPVWERETGKDGKLFNATNIRDLRGSYAAPQRDGTSDGCFLCHQVCSTVNRGRVLGSRVCGQ